MLVVVVVMAVVSIVLQLRHVLGVHRVAPMGVHRVAAVVAVGLQCLQRVLAVGILAPVVVWEVARPGANRYVERLAAVGVTVLVQMIVLMGALLVVPIVV